MKNNEYDRFTEYENALLLLFLGFREKSLPNYVRRFKLSLDLSNIFGNVRNHLTDVWRVHGNVKKCYDGKPNIVGC